MWTPYGSQLTRIPVIVVDDTFLDVNCGEAPVHTQVDLTNRINTTVSTVVPMSW